jgi:hypothetical protein
MLAKWFNPAGVVDAKGGESILLSCFEPKSGGAAAPGQAPARQAPPAFDDSDVPF